MPRHHWPKTKPKNPKTRIQPHPPKEKPLRDANHARAEVPTKGVCSVDFTSVLQLLHRLAAVFMQQAQANPSARVASCLPTGTSQRRVDLGFFWTLQMMNCTNTMLLWDRTTGDVLLKPWPEKSGDREHSGYASTLACWKHYREGSEKERTHMLLQEFACLVVSHNIDPHKLHNVLLGLSEWHAVRPDRFNHG